MTTSWAYFVRGRWVAAGEANVGGTLLALSAVTAVPWLLGSAARGRWIWVRPADWAVFSYCVGAVLIILADWVYRVGPRMAEWSSG
jgi:hypothetical protein